jgi:hypothetical protein
MALHHLQIGSAARLNLALVTRVKASSSARRAKPSAAAATVERKTSSTDIAILNHRRIADQADAGPGNR